MILLNEHRVYADTFISGNLTVDFLSTYDECVKSSKIPLIKWLRTEDDYREFACMYYLLRYMFCTKLQTVRLNMFVHPNRSSILECRPYLSVGPLRSDCDWIISKCHIEDDPEYTGAYTVICYELTRRV